MKATLNWLREFVEIDGEVEKLSDLLTMSGLEVEEIKKIGGGLDRVIVGEVVAAENHPKVENLTLATVATGSEKVLIVTSAPNARVGLKTALALPGVTLPGGVKVEKLDFKGVESVGVLLAEDEIGLTADHSGLIELPKSSPVGQPIKEVLDTGDYLLDIGITPNRADCLSIIGLAREISALTNTPFKPRGITLEEVGPDIATLTSIEVLDKDLCPRYVARVISEVKSARSPLWMRRRLYALDVRDINNIVDITNYVLLECGQPLHAFDYHLLAGNRIVVKRAKAGEKFFTLDAVERNLTPDILMICDAEKSVAIGGVMGGANSEIQDDTNTVLLESAYFYPPSIHRTARYLGLVTEAAYRFERGVDSEGSLYAANRAADLMRDLAGGVIARGFIDCRGELPSRPKIPIRTARTKKILGYDIDVAEVKGYLQRLQIDVAEETNGSITAVPPSFRIDLTREIDLIEEVARLKGFQEIGETFPTFTMGYADTSHEKRIIDKISNVMFSCGFDEIITYSFIGGDSFDKLMLPPDDLMRDVIRLKNPLNEDMTVMRTSLVPGMLKAAVTNINRLNTDIRLFEISRVFLKTGGKLPEEHNHLVALISGQRNPKQWGVKSEPVDFYDVKGVWETIVDELGITGTQYGKNENAPFLDGRESCVISVEGNAVGVIGRIHERVMEGFDLSKPAFIIEADITRLLKYTGHTVVFSPIPRFPPVLRDIAIVIDDAIPSTGVIGAIKAAAEGIIKDITLFDVYIGKQIERRKKSVAVTIRYQSDERTLTDIEVNDIHARVMVALQNKLGAQIR